MDALHLLQAKEKLHLRQLPETQQSPAHFLWADGFRLLLYQTSDFDFDSSFSIKRLKERV